MKPLIALLILVLISISSFAQEGKSVLAALSAKYHRAGVVEMNVEKVVKSDLLGKETTYSGVIFLSSGLFRWKNQTPEETLLVFDGNHVWNVQYPTSDFPGPMQVTKAKVDKRNKSQLLIGNLFGKKTITEQLKIVKETKTDKEFQFDAIPLAADVSIASVKLTVNSEAKTLTALSYVDDVGNLTTMKFSEVKFKPKKEKSLFKFTPPKDAQVTNL